MNRLARGVIAPFVFVIGVVVMPGVVAPAGADPIGSCTTTAGTIVAVDFSHWGGPVARGCGVGQPNGYALLHAAGFSTTGDNHDGPAFICRLGNRAFAGGIQYPTPAQDPCVLTPPTTAYWSYWTAAPGQSSWSYSTSGAIGNSPSAGGAELWTFGGTDTGGATGSGRPTFGPDSVRAHNVAPLGGIVTPTTTAPTAPTTTADSQPGAVHPATPGPGPGPGGPAVTSAGPPAGPTDTTVGAASATTVPGASATPTTTAGAAGSPGPTIGPKFVDALPAVRRHTSSGSIVPLLIGVGLVLALGAGAAGTMWRRRAAE